MSVAAVHGVLPVDKPPGPTSHDVVASARRALGVRRIGHTGTLDPFASGLLLLCVGAATRIAEYLSGLDKRYEATAVLGIATDTEDREGAVVSTSEGWRHVGREAVEAALAPLRGEILQVPPRYSAKKVGGVSAHRRARRGEAVVLEPRTVVVHELELTGFEPPEVRLSVLCSSGTYVRSLARDLGDALGVGAHLTGLRRTAIGPHGVAGALPVDALVDPARVRSAMMRPLEALSHLPRVAVTEEGALDLRHGRPAPVAAEPDVGPVLATSDATLIAVGEVREGRFHPRKVFHA